MCKRPWLLLELARKLVSKTCFLMGSMYTTIMELGPKRASLVWSWGPDSIMAVHMDLLGSSTLKPNPLSKPYAFTFQVLRIDETFSCIKHRTRDTSISRTLP